MLLFAGVLIVRKCTPVWVKIQNPVKLCDADKSMEHAQLFRWTRSTRTPAKRWESLPSEGREGICNSQQEIPGGQGWTGPSDRDWSLGCHCTSGRARAHTVCKAIFLLHSTSMLDIDGCWWTIKTCDNSWSLHKKRFDMLLRALGPGPGSRNKWAFCFAGSTFIRFTLSGCLFAKNFWRSVACLARVLYLSLAWFMCSGNSWNVHSKACSSVFVQDWNLLQSCHDQKSFPSSTDCFDWSKRCFMMFLVTAHRHFPWPSDRVLQLAIPTSVAAALAAQAWMLCTHVQTEM